MSAPHMSGLKSRSKRTPTDGSRCATTLPVVLILGISWIIIIEYFGLRELGPVWPKVMLSEGHTRVESEIIGGDAHKHIASTPSREDSRSSLGPTPKDKGEMNPLNDIPKAEAAHVLTEPASTTVEVWDKGVLTPERRPRRR